MGPRGSEAAGIFKLEDQWITKFTISCSHALGLKMGTFLTAAPVWGGGGVMSFGRSP